MKTNTHIDRILGSILLLFSICANLSFAESFTGTVLDEHKSPLADVNITIPALKRGISTNQAGQFTFENLPTGIYTVQFAYLGYRQETRTVNISASDATLTVTLQPSPLEFSAITVTAKPQPTDILSSPQAVTALEGRQLARLRGQSIMASLAKAPGVSTYTTGAGIVKPVIRGLTSQRVLVVTDGIRQEGQQWGDEHGPEIDALDVDRIEVVRGPSSVLYGSDALGGVINVIKAKIPSANLGAPTLGGGLLLNGFSNNRAGAGALSLYGARGDIGYRTNLSLRDGHEIRTPDGKLFNSGMNELDGSGMIGMQREWGSISADYSHFGQELQIHEDPAEDPDATPFQKIQHDKVHVHGNFPFPKLRLEVNGGWQRNNRREFEEKDAEEPVLNLVLNTTTVEVKGHHNPIGPAFGTIGLSVMSQKNHTLAEEALIPGFDQVNLAGFIYEEIPLRDLTFSAGLRFDARSLDVKKNEELGVAAQTRDYKDVTGTAGVVWRALEPLAFAVNLGRAWRAPTAFELFVNGVHEGTVRFEIGDNNLDPEESLNLDLSVRYASARLQGEATFFQNRINRYISLSPTGEIDAESGFDKYQHKQADATLLGSELSFQAQATNWLILNGGADFIHGTNDETDQPLPLIPANRFKLGARLTKTSLGKLMNPYVSFNAMIVSAQNRVEVFETKTDGYELFDVGLGGEIPFGARKVSIDLAVKNLFDKAYRDHLNRYKEYALNPGRSITLKVSLPFAIVE